MHREGGCGGSGEREGGSVVHLMMFLFLFSFFFSRLGTMFEGRTVCACFSFSFSFFEMLSF